MKTLIKFYEIHRKIIIEPKAENINSLKKSRKSMEPGIQYMLIKFIINNDETNIGFDWRLRSDKRYGIIFFVNEESFMIIFFLY